MLSVLEHRVDVFLVVEVRMEFGNVRVTLTKAILDLELFSHLTVKVILVKQLFLDEFERHFRAGLLLHSLEYLSKLA